MKHKEIKMMKISAKVIADSVSSINDVRIVTFELEYPRFIHSELMTHRVFSRNAASSRAIPVNKTIDMVRHTPAYPVHWGKNQPGMQAKEEFSGEDLACVKLLWKEAAMSAADNATTIQEYGVHKQITNRILEPFVWMKTIVTATEWSNWFELRAHEDAQPEIHELALRMREALEESDPTTLFPGMWHCPYVEFYMHQDGPSDEDIQQFFIYDAGKLVHISVEDAIKISASCCAQVSYRKLDDSIDKAVAIYDKLINSRPMHASPIEHQATPMIDCGDINLQIEVDGVTHVDKNYNGWSGNFMWWIQYRQLVG